MSRAGRLLPLFVAIGTGVISGIYIFQPLIIEERRKQLAEATLNIQTTPGNNAPPNTAPTAPPNASPPPLAPTSNNARPS
ncbi:hypothetical protein FRC08_002764 [Ceratobasidium sp. 394]|nr:hypothetical protein FRC08_002764 [Ceratobasidium sp. 394]